MRVRNLDAYQMDLISGLSSTQNNNEVGSLCAFTWQDFKIPEILCVGCESWASNDASKLGCALRPHSFVLENRYRSIIAAIWVSWPASPDSLPPPTQLHRPALAKTAQTRSSGWPECSADRSRHLQL